MNFLELYELCKPYVEYIEANKETIENLIRIDEAEDIEELFILSDEIEVSFERDLKIFDKAFRLQTDIELAIREEVIAEFIRSNDLIQKSCQQWLVKEATNEYIRNWIDKHENQLWGNLSFLS